MAVLPLLPPGPLAPVSSRLPSASAPERSGDADVAAGWRGLLSASSFLRPLGDFSLVQLKYIASWVALRGVPERPGPGRVVMQELSEHSHCKLVRVVVGLELIERRRDNRSAE